MQNRIQHHKIALLTVAVAMATAMAQAQTTPAPGQGRPYGQPGTEQNRPRGQQQGALDQDRQHAGQKGSLIQASKIIGKEVKNQQGEQLGEVKDLILDPQSGSVHYAIISHGGTLGVGEKEIAVPASELNCSGDQVTLAASKADFDNAPATPTGAWSAAAGAEWAQNIDGYYGQPSPMSGRFERERMGAPGMGREPVRATRGAAERLTNPPSDDNLKEHINQTLRTRFQGDTAQTVEASISNGTVTLTGTVQSEAQKRQIENEVQALPGVNRVENQLKVQGQ